MSAARTAIYTLCVATVAGALVFFVFFGDAEQRNDATAAGVWQGFRARDLVALRAVRGAESVVIAPLADRGLRAATARAFRIITPRALPADHAAIRALLARLSAVRAVRDVRDAAAGAAYGLLAPRVALEASTAAGTFKLELGDLDRFGGGTFARVTHPSGKGARIVVLSEDDAKALALGLFELRDRRLITADLTNATALRIDVGKTRASLLRGSGGEWSVAGLTSADEPGVNATLGALAELRAVRYVHDADRVDLVAAGFEPPAARVRIDVGGAAHRVVFARAKDGSLLAADPAGGPAAEVAPSIWPVLDRAPSTWRGKRALRFDRAVVGAVRWSERGSLGLLTRLKNGDWQALSPKPLAVGEDAVQRLLGALEALTMGEPDDSPRALAHYGLQAPSLEIAIDDTRGRRLDALHVGVERGGRYYARSTRWPTVFRIAAAELEALPFKALVGAAPTGPPQPRTPSQG